MGSHRYFGSPQIDVVDEDFATLSKESRLEYSVSKQILWESEDATEKELSEMEVKFIKHFQSNNPAIGYNRWPKYKEDIK